MATKNLSVTGLKLDDEDLDLHSGSVWLTVAEHRAGNQVIEGLRSWGVAVMLNTLPPGLMEADTMRAEIVTDEGTGTGQVIITNIEITSLNGVTLQGTGPLQGLTFPSIKS